MAALIETVLSTSGSSVYIIIRDLTGLVWNGTSFVAYNSANWSTYAISMTEQSGSYYYNVSFPAAIAAGKYSYVVYLGSPATLGDPPLDSGSIDWGGSTENYLGLIIAKLPSGIISDFDESVDTVNLSANQSGVTVGTVNALGASASASVKTQIDTSIGSDPINELSAVPSSTPTLKTAMMLLFMALRNKRTSTATSVGIYNSSGALIAAAVQSDNGVIHTKENFS